MKLKSWFKKKFYWSLNPLKYSTLKKEFQNKTFNLLDIGAGNHSAKKTKLIFPACKYYGLDNTVDYNNDKNDFNLMEQFYKIDLNDLLFDTIPDNYFDAIIMSHILEHLSNGDIVLNELIKKLKNNGIIYIEYPGIRSTKLPSMKGTLNFFDDKTHVRIYSLKEIYNILLKNSVSPIKGGTRRNITRILFLPFLVTFRFIITRNLVATDFWDLFGFAEFVVGKKI